MKRVSIRAILLVACVATTIPHRRSSLAQQRPQSLTSKTAQLDLSGVRPTYANFSRITGTPEELIVDFALNPEPHGVPTDPIKVEQRIVMNYYTAKRFAAALQLSIDRHEQAFGVIETDVQKRVKQRR